MTRHSDWKDRLQTHLHGLRLTPFRIGRHDCALFAAGCVEAMTGTDFAAPYRGRYATLRGGLRVLRRDGFTDAVALAEHHLVEVHPAFAREGDVAVVPTDDGPALGIVAGDILYLLRPDGLGIHPRDAMTRSFSVI